MGRKCIRLICAALTAAAIAGGMAPASAFEYSAPYTEMAAFTADVYVCDSEDRTVILKNVTTDQQSRLAQSMRPALEYEIVPLTRRALYDRSGKLMELSDINETCLDGRVRFLAARRADRLKIVWLQVL